MAENKNATQNQPRRGPMGGPGHGPGMGEKPKNLKRAISRFLSFCKPYSAVIIISFILSAAGAILSVLGPDKLGEITAYIQEGMFTGIDLAAIMRIGVTLIIMYALSAVFSYGQGYIIATVTQKLSYSMRGQLSSKINRLPLAYFDNTSFGDVLSRVTNDVDTMGQMLNSSVGQLTSAICLFFGSIIMMFVTNATLALVAIGSTIIGFVLMMVIMMRSQKYFKAQQKELGKINGHIEEIYAALNTVRAYNGEAESEKTFTEINDRLLTSAWKAQFISGIMFPLMGFIGNLGYVSVCAVSASLILKGSIGFDVLVSFMIYIRLFSNPLSQFAQSFTSLQSAAAATERVFEFLDEKELSPEEENAVTDHDSRGNVEFRDVKFSYKPEREIIKGFSAKAERGQKIAIVGPTGSGKTTIVNLLMRFYEPNSGQILIDGIPISKMTRECVHKQFGMVLQDTWMFDGTIRENVAYSMQNVTESQVVDACKAVGLDHFIRTLPDGYDTVLGETVSLSDGQKQLLSIARAIVENAPLLILDEATSSVDTRTEIQIQQAMERLTEGRTSFIIAHRLSTIKGADLILVMRDGNIVERGTHMQLLEENGFYAELYNSQFDDGVA